MIPRSKGVIVLGDSGVGKTMEIERILKGMGLSISPESTTLDEVQVTVKTINSNIPLEEYTHNTIKIKSRNRIREVVLAIKDLAGQYNDATKIKTTNLNLAGTQNSVVVELVADTTRPETLDSLIDNWLEIIKENDLKFEPEFSVYLSKAGLSDKIDYQSIKDGDYSSLESYAPRLKELISKTNAMVFIGDMDIEINGEPHQAELYLIKTNEWLDIPIEVGTSADKIIPLMRYLHRNKSSLNEQLSDETRELIQQIEEDYGRIITY